MNQRLKELAITIYNLKNGPFYKKGCVNIVRNGRNIVFDNVKIKSAGKNNTVTIGNGARLHGVTIQLFGDNNIVEIGEGCSLCDTLIVTEENENTIKIGNVSSTTGGVVLAAIEGTSIIIGEDAMISRDIYIATGDGHGIVNIERKRTNHSEDIKIGNHVWIGTQCIIHKGVQLPDDLIVGAGSVVSKSINKSIVSNCIVAGNPATVIKTGCNWTRNRKEGEPV